MKKAGLVAVAVLVAVLWALPAAAEAGRSAKPVVVVTDIISITAPVDAIDYPRRLITLKGPEGNTVTLKAGKRVRRFDEITVGNLVKAEYLDAVAVIVRKPDGKSVVGYLGEVLLAPRDDRSDRTAVDTIELMATVEAVDQAKRTVTFKGPEGNVRTIGVDERVRRLRNIQKGDKVLIRLTEAIALYLKPVEATK